MIILPDSLEKILKCNVIHHTWANTFRCYPEYYFQPTSIEEVVELVNYARLKKKTLLVVGSGHSPSHLTMTNEWMINLDKLDKILSYKPNSGVRNDGQEISYTDVTVEAGIRIYQLNDLLDKEGLALQNLGSITEQSIAGLISTGTHGGSAFHGVVSRQIVDLTLVNGLGEIIYCSESENQEVFKAALLSLGKIGVIVQATIRTVPKFNIKYIEQVVSFDNLLLQWDRIWTSSEFIKVHWYPYVGKCIVTRGNKTTDDVTVNYNKTSTIYNKFWKFFHEFLCLISCKIYPKLTPSISKFLFNKLFGHLLNKSEDIISLKTIPTDIISKAAIVKHSFDAFEMDCLFSQYVNEWASPLTNGPEVLRLLNHSIQSAAQKKDYFISDPIEIRCSNNTLSSENVKHSNDIGSINGNNCKSYLEPSPTLQYVNKSSSLNLDANDSFGSPLTNITNSQLTLYINLVMFRPFGFDVPIGKFFKNYEDILIAADGKPHWAKNFIGAISYLPENLRTSKKVYADGEMIGFANKVKEWYGNDLIKFKQISSIQDPDNIFLANKNWALINGIID